MTRLGDFWKFYVTNFVLNYAQIIGNVLGYFEVCHFLRKTNWVTLMASIEQFRLYLIPTSGHTAANLVCIRRTDMVIHILLLPMRVHACSSKAIFSKKPFKVHFIVDKQSVWCMGRHTPFYRRSPKMYSTFTCLLRYLHQEGVLVAIIFDHVIVKLDQSSLLILLVQVANIPGVDFVLGLDSTDQTGDGWWNLEYRKPFCKQRKITF